MYVCLHMLANCEEKPGPLDYFPDPRAVLPSVPCFSMTGRSTAGRDYAQAAGVCLPGPGDYEAVAQCSNGPAWTMGSRAACAVADQGCSESPGETLWVMCTFDQVPGSPCIYHIARIRLHTTC